jgi:hypothetical protein
MKRENINEKRLRNGGERDFRGREESKEILA